jgi:hypothetical protein
MRKKITIPYFPLGFKIISPLFLGAGGYLFYTNHWFWGSVLLLFVVMIFTTNYVTEIDLVNKLYRDYLWFFSIPLNQDSGKFNKLEHIVITKGNYAQNINTRSRSTKLDWSDYTATLIMDNARLDLLTRNSKSDLLKELKEFVQFLKVDVEDQTTNQYYWIDMSRVE